MLPDVDSIWFSHTLLGNLSCPKKLKYYLEAKEANESWVPSDAAVRGIRIHEYCDSYLKTGIDPVVDSIDHDDAFNKIYDFLVALRPNLLAAEFEARRTEGNFQAKGRMDAADNDGWIYDWKFPGRDWDFKKLSDYTESQAWLYMWLGEKYLQNLNDALLLDSTQPLHPKIKGMKFVVVAKTLQIHEVPYDEQKVLSALQRYKAAMAKIRYMMRANDFEPKPTRLCGWCSYKEVCPSRY